MSELLHTVTRSTLPDNADLNTVYRLTPIDPDEAYYQERTDRNIGWITKEEQQMLKGAVVGIAGCGGMGGTLAQIFVRLGVGEVRIADCEEFDPSNINRQFAARRNTVGVSKAIATARAVRDISDDTTLVVYPQGIVEETVESFVTGCDVICDEIEFWAIGSRILLHQYARMIGVSSFVCSTVGFGTRLMKFNPSGHTMESCVSLSLEDALIIQNKIQTRTANSEDVRSIMTKLTTGLVPNVHGYTLPHHSFDDHALVLERLEKENSASILSTNPSMASGFLADHVLLHLLNGSRSRDVVEPPEPPGYLYFDAARMDARVVTPGEVRDEN